MKIGKLDIKKAYYGSKELTTNNAFVGSVPLIDTPPTGWVTFRANQSSTIGLNNLSSYQKLWYSNNKKDWNVFNTSTSISMNAGDEIYVAGILRRDINSSNYTNFSITGDVSVSGNIVYLWNYPDPDGDLKSYCGYNLFYGCTGLTDASELTLGTSDTILASSCYNSMFYNCSSLTTAPELLATTLAPYCYNGMFYGCTSLITAPSILPATKLTEGCYGGMFIGCSNLNYIKCLATDISATDCTTNWVSGVASTGTFISNVDSSWPTGTSGIPEGWDNSQKEFTGLTFTAQEASTIGVSNKNGNAPDLWYAINKGNWVHWSDTYDTISLNQNDVMWVKGNNPNGFSLDYNKNTTFNISGNIEGSGNIMSLVNYESDIPCNFCFVYLFSRCNGLKDASNLLLPATTLVPSCYSSMFSGCINLITAPSILPTTRLANNCYSYMFSGCSSLTTAPELPATKLAYRCYYGMFNGCSSLTTAPELPATSLAIACYWSMFNGCSSLIKAPVLPATKLAPYCYENMFSDCRKLNYIKCLATDISSSDCTNNWVSGVASTGTFVKDSKANWPTGSSGIPTGWTIEQANYPGLKFEAIEDSEFSWSCNSSSFENKFYYSLDDGLTWANYTDPIPFSKGTVLCLKGDYPEGLSNNSRTVRFALSGKVKASGNIMSLIDNGACNTLTIPSNNCFRELFIDCTSLITPPELPAITLKDYCYYLMFCGCTSLTTAPELPATTLANYCYGRMFDNCASITKAPELPATTLSEGCYGSMFINCSSLIYPPALPATTLKHGCYNNMFNDCTSLVYPPALPATTLNSSCYTTMFYNCRNLIIAPALPATTLASSCYAYMFYNCTSLIKTPELPATSLINYCYKSMFEGCSRLNYIKCLATNISAPDCTLNWVSGVPSTGTFVKNPDANWPTGTSGIPSGWEVVDAK